MPTILILLISFMLNRRFLRLKVVKTLYGYLPNEYSAAQVQKNLDYAIQKSFLLYLYLIQLTPALQHYAWLRQEQAKLKKRPTPEELTQNLNLINNVIATQVAQNKPLQDILNKHGLKWNKNNDNTLKVIYDQWMSSDIFKNYLGLQHSTFEDDKTVISDLYTHLLPDQPELYNTLEELSIFWDCDEVDFFLARVHKTYQNVLKNENFTWFTLYKNEDDQKFPHILIKNVVENQTKYIELLQGYCQNWDLERVAQMDLILLLTALAEFISCDTIPVKVTMNEYVEIAKYYSTPNSYNFINGILDKCSKDLIEKHQIIKSENADEEL